MTKSALTLSIAAVVFGLLGVANTAHANLITNGSFDESPHLTQPAIHIVPCVNESVLHALKRLVHEVVIVGS